MFKKFFKFLYGYVIIKVYGKGAERFINICLRRNIDVWNIKPFDDGIEMCIYIKDFFHIRQVRKKSNVKIKISDVGQTIRCPKCNLKINVKKDSEFDKNIKNLKNK